MIAYTRHSIFLKYLKKINQGYLAIEERMSFVYLDSFTGQLIKKIIQLLKISFQLSIFGRLTKIEQIASRDFFRTSNIIRAFSAGIRYLKYKLTIISARSSLFAYIKDMKYSFFLKPLQVGGTVIVIMIIINLVLSIIIQKQITIWHWLISGLLLYIGLAGLFCNAEWEDIKKTSFFIKNI